MKLTELKTLLETKSAKEIFGDDPEAVYRKYAKITHPDLNPDQVDLAKAVFQLLLQKKDDLNAKPITVQSKTHIYKVETVIGTGDYSTVHLCSDNIVLKVSNDVAANKKLTNEYDTICKLHQASGGDSYSRHFLMPIEHFIIKDDKKANKSVIAYKTPPNLYTLRKIKERYPNGIDPRDSAWMFNRVLEALGFIHTYKFVHGAILPENLLFDIENHNVIIVGWTHSVQNSGVIKTISGPYRAHYPKEVFNKGPATGGVDIFMAAKCMKYITANPPPTFDGILKACLLENPRSRPQDAWELHNEFNDVLRNLYGKRTFRVFTMS